MDSLTLKDQKDLGEPLELNDRLNLEIERDGLNKDNPQRLYDVYDAVSKLLVDTLKKLPQVNY